MDLKVEKLDTKKEERVLLAMIVSGDFMGKNPEHTGFDPVHKQGIKDNCQVVPELLH